MGDWHKEPLCCPRPQGNLLGRDIFLPPPPFPLPFLSSEFHVTGADTADPLHSQQGVWAEGTIGVWGAAFGMVLP